MQEPAAQDTNYPLQDERSLPHDQHENLPDTLPQGTTHEAMRIPVSTIQPTEKLLPPKEEATPRVLLPQRGLYYATMTGAIAGVVTALLTIVGTLIFAGTFQAASQQIAADRLTVKTALALAGLGLLDLALCLLIGFLVGTIIGRIAVRRWLGFLAGALAGALFYLITFLVSLIPTYPGNLTLHGIVLTTGLLVLDLLLLCLWSIGGGLVSLFGTWVATVKHPHYTSRRA